MTTQWMSHARVEVLLSPTEGSEVAFSVSGVEKFDRVMLLAACPTDIDRPADLTISARQSLTDPDLNPLNGALDLGRIYYSDGAVAPTPGGGVAFSFPESMSKVADVCAWPMRHNIDVPQVEGVVATPFVGDTLHFYIRLGASEHPTSDHVAKFLVVGLIVNAEG